MLRPSSPNLTSEILMTVKPLVLTLALVAVCMVASSGYGQKPGGTKATSSPADEGQAASSSAAHAELLLRKTETLSDLESLLIDYTEDFPRIKELKFALALLERDLARLSRVKVADSSRLTVALGKLMVRKIELETELWKLLETYKEEHPEVKRARKKVSIYEAAISEILK